VQRLQDDWLLWNRDLDGARGLDTGILAGIELQAATVREITPLGPLPPPPADGVEPGKPSIDLQGSLQEEGVALAWELKDGTAQEFYILRASGREPSYPQDSLARVAGDARTFFDRGAAGGTSYTYRIACEIEAEMVYSNAFVVAIPQMKPVINLSGEAVDGGSGMPVIQLSWSVEGDPRPDYYALVRAELSQMPLYPPTGSMTTQTFGVSGPFSWTDSSLYMGYTYNYCVYAIKNGAVLVQSNIVSVYVDTSVIMNRPR
jgi:hypothetical protein